MVPLIFLFVVLFVAIIALFFYCRHRKLEAELNPSATNKSVVGRPIPAIDHPQSSSHIQQIQHSGAYGGGGRHRGTLPPIPVNESTEKGSEYREKGGFLGLVSLRVILLTKMSSASSLTSLTCGGIGVVITLRWQTIVVIRRKVVNMKE